MSLIAIINDLCHDLVAIADSLGILSCDIDILCILLIVTKYKSIITFSLKSTHNLRGPTLKDFDNRALLTLSAAGLLLHKDSHLVLMHGSSYRICRNKDIIFLVLKFHKSKALLVAYEGTLFDQALFLKLPEISFL